MISARSPGAGNADLCGVGKWFTGAHIFIEIDRPHKGLPAFLVRPIISVKLLLLPSKSNELRFATLKSMITRNVCGDSKPL